MFNIDKRLTILETQLQEQGFEVEYGKIGKKSTYCLLTYGDDEYVGYTYVKDLSLDNPILGKFKALSNAISRLDSGQE